MEDLQVTLVLIGVALLVGAIVGGGVELAGVKLPRLGSTRVRVALGSLGGLAVIGGVVLILMPRPGAQQDGGTAGIEFTLADELAEGMVHETLQVFVDGEHRGQLEISSARRRDFLEITVPAQDAYEYRITGAARWQRPDGQGGTEDVKIEDSGMLSVEPGATYAVRTSRDGTVRLAD